MKLPDPKLEAARDLVTYQRSSRRYDIYAGLAFLFSLIVLYIAYVRLTSLREDTRSFLEEFNIVDISDISLKEMSFLSMIYRAFQLLNPFNKEEERQTISQLLERRILIIIHRGANEVTNDCIISGQYTGISMIDKILGFGASYLSGDIAICVQQLGFARGQMSFSIANLRIANIQRNVNVVYKLIKYAVPTGTSALGYLYHRIRNQMTQQTMRIENGHKRRSAKK